MQFDLFEKDMKFYLNKNIHSTIFTNLKIAPSNSEDTTYILGAASLFFD
jgi:hypothetical protein